MLSLNDVMVSAHQVKFLELSAKHKDQIEVYFDFGSITKQLNRNRQQTTDEDDENGSEDSLGSQVAELFNAATPNIE